MAFRLQQQTFRFFCFFFFLSWAPSDLPRTAFGLRTKKLVLAAFVALQEVFTLRGPANLARPEGHAVMSKGGEAEK